MKKEDQLRYSIYLAYLSQLLKKELISEKEYTLIRNRLMK